MAEIICYLYYWCFLALVNGKIFREIWTFYDRAKPDFVPIQSFLEKATSIFILFCQVLRLKHIGIEFYYYFILNKFYPMWNLLTFFLQKRCQTRVSVQGVKSLGGHFACLCQGFEFYEVKKKILLLFFKKKMEILLHF